MSRFLVALFVVIISFSTFAADTYNIDPVHSSANFKIKHMNVSNVYGRFNTVTGTIKFDDANLKDSSVSIEVKADSIDTNNAKRDQHVKGPDFLDAAQFATITFKSTAIEKGEGDNYVVTGDFTLHGVTKSIKVTMTKVGAANGKIGFDGLFSIKRSDYGIKYMPDALGDDIFLAIGVEAGLPK